MNRVFQNETHGAREQRGSEGLTEMVISEGYEAGMREEECWVVGVVGWFGISGGGG